MRGQAKFKEEAILLPIFRTFCISNPFQHYKLQVAVRVVAAKQDHKAL